MCDEYIIVEDFKMDKYILLTLIVVLIIIKPYDAKRMI